MQRVLYLFVGPLWMYKFKPSIGRFPIVTLFKSSEIDHLFNTYLRRMTNHSLFLLLCCSLERNLWRLRPHITHETFTISQKKHHHSFHLFFHTTNTRLNYLHQSLVHTCQIKITKAKEDAQNQVGLIFPQQILFCWTLI